MGSRWTWFSALAVCQAAWLPGGVPSRSAVSFHSPRTAAATMNTDYYGRLGVTRNAEDKDIKNAYRKAARQWHPDVNPSEEAKEKFQAINEAYSVLSDKDLRARYDQFGEAGVKGQGAPNMQDFDLGDIFETFFGGQAGAGGRQGPGRAEHAGLRSGRHLRDLLRRPGG